MKNVFIFILASVILLGMTQLGWSGINDGIVAYYPFIGNANDESDNGNNGTEYGGITYGEGVTGQAVIFDGLVDGIC